MKLVFVGADHEVTGSCHYLEVAGKHILVDYGMEQGVNVFENVPLPVAESMIDYVFLTHAHVDHSGLLPLLYARGFRGQIYTTDATADLCSIMLRDCAHIQSAEAEWKNRKAKRSANNAVVEPLYTMEDADGVIRRFVPCHYNTIVEVCEGVKIRFTDIGHLLGSASIEVWLTEDGNTKKIVFSGDIGNVDQPIIRNPQFFTGADYVVMESTYGDRNHDPVVSYTAELAKIIDDTFSKGGNVIIPSFAVGRTQELLYFMREMKKEGLVKSNPDFTVCVDSPLANEATKIFSGDLRGYLDDDALEVVKDGERLFTFPGLTMTESSEESKMLNMDKSSKVIISASGMCDAGRIRHHLKHNLWREECAIVFVGYQGEGTLGRHLLEGAKQVRLFGEDIAVNASIYNFKGLSSHADRDHLIEWIEHIQEPTPQQIFDVHGDAPVTEIFANTLREKGLPAHAPLYEEVFDLSKNVMLAAGVELLPKKTSYASNGHPASAYHEVELAAMDLFSIIRASKGSSNKDLKKMAAQIRTLTERFKA